MNFQSRTAILVMLAGAVACGEAPAVESRPDHDVVSPGTLIVLRDTMLMDAVMVPAVAEPMVRATLSTRLMGHVTAVLAREGERVSAGAPLVRLDARDVAARRDQAEAGLRSAEAASNEATQHATRIRALYADSAAPRAQLDAAEAALARAEQGTLAARAAVTEVGIMAEYAEVRAPFSGVVVQRFVDPGAFVTPGSPLILIEDATRLRVVASVPPPVAGPLRRGATLRLTIEGVETSGVVEGVVPAPGASLMNVQVLVDNPSRRFSSGSAATLSLPGALRKAILVPAAAVVRNGDLTGVRVRTNRHTITRWVRLGREFDGVVEILSGVAPGDSLVVPVVPAGA